MNWAELSAVYRALQLFGDKNVVINTDSDWTVKILDGSYQPKLYKNLAKKARKLKKTTGTIIRWISRDKNQVADALATWASGYRDSVNS